MKKILILGGGISKERKISLETAKQVNKVLKRDFKTVICEPNNDLIQKIKTFAVVLVCAGVEFVCFSAGKHLFCFSFSGVPPASAVAGVEGRR